MDYLCGVVEGFYGTPWRCSERKELFVRLQLLGLNTYMYAPKDDAKHRRLWREKYTKAEIDTLKELIAAAQLNHIDFVYSISPGLDIIFSSPEDVKLLHEKLKQVYGIGCHSFAILFDDIDPELCLTDKLEFASSGDAQVYITNKLYEWFDNLKTVLFCPTEYCTTRAKPSIELSKYLETLGSKMHSGVQILWTGPKVISETISSKSLDELMSVLKRKPVIWDNIHANDYDHRRVFLGPYKGRQMEIYNKTSGILTNPNCEYECNYIAIHSLGSWLKNAKELRLLNKDLLELKEGNFAESEENIFEYDSKKAMFDAVLSWMDMFKLTKDSFQGSPNDNNKLTFNANINSLINEMKKDEQIERIEDDACKKSDVKVVNECDIESGEISSPHKKAKSSIITVDDVSLLCDLFHLPYEHGEKGQKIITEFKWLKENAIDYKNPPPQNVVDVWTKNCAEFQDLCNNVEILFDRMQDISNKRLLQQLYPYIYDVKEVVHLLSSFAKWLGSEKRQKGESFISKDPEAWMFRGGIAAEMESLLPSKENVSDNSGKNLKVQTIRPYLPQDKQCLYKFCRELLENPDEFEDSPDLPGDSLLGAYLEFSPSYVFVVEKNDDICGFVAAHSNAKILHQQIKEKFIPLMQSKYKQPASTAHCLTSAEELINRFYHHEMNVPDEVLDTYAAVLTTRIQESTEISLTADRLLKCIFSMLKTNVYCELTPAMKESYEEFLKQAGFFEILLTTPCDGLYYGHTV